MVIYTSKYKGVPKSTRPLHDIFIQAIEQTIHLEPHKKAFIAGENRHDFITFEQLHRAIYSLASYLDHIGFRKQTACIVLPNSWHYSAIWLGVSLQGGAVSGASALFTDYELERQFVDSQSTVVFTDQTHVAKVILAAKKAPTVKTIIVIGKPSEVPKGTVSWDTVQSTPVDAWRTEVVVDVANDVAILPYSSGTTGSPKGVMLTHQNFGTMIDMFEENRKTRMLNYIDPSWDWRKEHVIQFLPFYHIYGFGMMANALLNGVTSITMHHFDPDVFCSAIQEYKIRVLMLVPPILVFLAKHPIVAEYDLSSLEILLSGAAPAGKDLCDEVLKKYPNVKHLLQGYGMTEVSMVSHLPDLTEPQKFASVGKIAPGLEMRIVDLNGKDVPTGSKGEICIRGPIIMKGYLNRPEATAETIQDGWLHTGDIGYVDEEGNTFIVDRIKELIKVKGLQVPPAELEDLLLSNPRIQDAAVIGIPNRDTGELPKAYIVKADPKLTEKEVADFVAAKVSPYKHLKGGVEFIKEIPKSAAGKILRRVLRDRSLPSKI